MLFDPTQVGSALGGLPEITISHAIGTPELSTPAVPVMATKQFDDGNLRVFLTSQETPDRGLARRHDLYADVH